MKSLKISPPDQLNIYGQVTLNGSKSISNRALIISALCDSRFKIENLSNAKDTVTLNDILDNLSNFIDAKEGGTTYRFLTAFLCTQDDVYTLTGSQRMKERPIKVLVNALNQLGANIEYLENEGYPPLKIDGLKMKGGSITIPGDVSSQYLSALLMIGPMLSGGLQLTWTGTLVSRPYLMMTLNLMKFFGSKWELKENTISIYEGNYQPKDFYIEGDWSAASYYYSIAALSNQAKIELKGLEEESIQGDAVIAKMMKQFLVISEFDSENKSVKISKQLPSQRNGCLNSDFLECPDLAQTVISLLAGLQMDGEFSGLKTLKIKETDRVDALNKELSKFGAHFYQSQEDEWVFDASKIKAPTVSPTIETYEDHRMAMAIAPICLKFGSIIINEPDVVAKSYPMFWSDLESLGFQINPIGN